MTKKMSEQRELVYVSIPVEILTQEQAKELQAEMAGLLDTEMQQAVFNNAAYDAPDDSSQRLWKHLSSAMLLLGECDAVLFGPGWDYHPSFVCWVEFEAAIRTGKKCLYVWRDIDKKLRLLNMNHCGGPEKREEEE